MKKGLTTLLVILLAIGAMLVSCKAEVGTPADELVSVSFEEAASRSITATLETFNKDNYYWKYAAQKADDSGLTSGATVPYDIDGALPVKDGAKGLGSGEGTDYKAYRVAGFSQGLWNFKLWAYRDSNYSDLLFYGEAENVSLSRGGKNMAKVTVNPVSEGDGFIKIGEITFNPKKGTDTQYTVSKFIEVTNPDGSAVSGISYDTTTQTYTVPAGAYKVTVKFANAAQTIVYGEGYVIATVYSGLKTTIAGDLDELVTYAQFDADLNPDAVNVQAEAKDIVYDDSSSAKNVAIESASTAEKKVKTTVAREDVNTIIQQMADEQAVGTDASTTSLKLTLNVDPTDASEQSVTYEIGMKATLTYTKASETQTTEKPVTSLTNYVIVEIEMSSGLSSVTVKHSGESMDKCDTLDDLKAASSTEATHHGYYFYDPAGTLYIKTRTFSPFEIKYTAPANYVAEVDGVKYGTLAEAVAQVKDAGTSTVKLLADVALTGTIETTKTFTLNLNGFNITADGFRAIHVKEGTLTLAGEGIITANGDALPADQSVIRVGDNEGESAGLVVGFDVTITSNKAYGVTVFGKDASGQTLDVYGKIKVTGTASAISGNGTSTLTPTTINIRKCAEVYAENDYAIYHPERGTLTVYDETVIVGKGGIETKGGNVIINGGVITATATSVTHTEYNNGASTSGYALASVENKNYPGEANIYVSGGTVNGKIIVLKDTEAAFDPVIEISGGTYTVQPASEYLAEGFVAIENEDGTWAVLPKVVQDATEYGLIVSGYGIETWQPSYGKVTKKGMTFADGTFEGDKTVYRYYADGKIYIYDVSEVEGTSYTFREDVRGIRGYWSNNTINEITINSPIEQAYKQFEENTTITKVNFGPKATRIANRMFYAARGLTEVTLPSVACIESSAFQKSYITSIVIEAPAVVIEDTAFAACPYLKTIDIKGAATIGTEGANNFVARHCASLTDIYIRDPGTKFIGNKSMTFTHEENGNDGGVGITLHAANSSVYDALVAFSGSSVEKMTVVYPNNN